MSAAGLPLLSAPAATVYHAPWQALAQVVTRCDALIFDAPYSAKTHVGHDDGVSGLVKRGRGAEYGPDGGPRRAIDYAPWTEADVAAFVGVWAPKCSGWIVSITDHVLQAAWSTELERAGLYVFAPLPFVHVGRGVRLAGDGPSSWTCWIVAARPRTAEAAAWGTLPGAYIQPPADEEGSGYRSPVVGGKTTWLGRRLAEDYALGRDGKGRLRQCETPPLVVDPTSGGGALSVGALCAGCRVIAADAAREHAEMTARWCAAPAGPVPVQDRRRRKKAPAAGQGLLF